MLIIRDSNYPEIIFRIQLNFLRFNILQLKFALICISISKQYAARQKNRLTNI